MLARVVMLLFWLVWCGSKNHTGVEVFLHGGFVGGFFLFEYVGPKGLDHWFSALWSASEQALGACPLDCVAPGCPGNVRSMHYREPQFP